MCSERCASHLAPLAVQFGFVFTRGYQTRTALLLAGLSDEADRRERLAREFLQAKVPVEEAVELLLGSQAAFAVLTQEAMPVVQALHRAGFERDLATGGWSLWVRPSALGAR